MKKMYKQPSVEATQLQPSTVVLAGSPEPGVLPNNNNKTGDLLESEIVGG